MILTSRTLRLACVAAVATSLAACGGNSKKDKPTSTPPTTAAPTTSTVAPSPTPEAPAAINPFTGGKPSGHRVVSVKIDDTANGRPQLGIDKADIVYIEQVEGGLTRLLAVFNSSLPTVEAVRSVRASDTGILAQYGPIAYVASGGAPYPMQVLDRSNLITFVNDRGAVGFQRDSNRPAPYNLTSNLAQVASVAKGSRPKAIGFTWKRYSVSKLAKLPAGLSVQTVVGGTGVRFDWDRTVHQYVRVIDGVRQRTADNKAIATPNVIVQFCDVTPDPRDVDVVGNVSMHTHTVGKGRVVVYRNGHKIEGTWTRSKAGNGTHLWGKNGKVIDLEPGGAWVVLVAKGAPLT